MNIDLIPLIPAPDYPQDILIDLVRSTRIDLNYLADAENRNLVTQYSDQYGTGAEWKREALAKMSNDKLWTLYQKFKSKYFV